MEQSKLSVAVRLRPVSQKELAKEHCTIVARALDPHTVHICDPADEFNEDVLRKDRNRDKVYSYDHVFDEDAPQQLVFEKTTKTLLDSVIQGFNATVFAYGIYNRMFNSRLDWGWKDLYDARYRNQSWYYGTYTSRAFYKD
jgi:kinesin family protein 18/19